MELPKATSLCPRCSRALKISTSEPHLTRDGVNVLTYRCPIHEDIWISLVDHVEQPNCRTRDRVATEMNPFSARNVSEQT
jgi:hypothetical protein